VLQARSEFTPRSYPAYSNIRTLMRPEMRAVVGEGPPNVYNPPDVFNPALHPPPGAVDVLSIVEAGVDYQSVLVPDYTDFFKKPTFSGPPKVPIGKGAELHTQSGDDFCDGSVDSFCKRDGDSKCLLYAHNDGRNGIAIDNVSGWLVMNVPDLKNGYIALKFESWHGPDEIAKTKGWTTPLERRELKKEPNDYCDDFVFEYAIDGKVTALNKTEIKAQLYPVQRVVEVITLLNQPDYTGGEEKEVEVAVRMRGCPRDTGKVFSLTHVYWS
jgi:hypothetical protein